MVQYTFSTSKIYFDGNEQRFIEDINKLRAKEIISIKTGIPTMTTTRQCFDVYYSYYI